MKTIVSFSIAILLFIATGVKAQDSTGTKSCCKKKATTHACCSKDGKGTSASCTNHNGKECCKDCTSATCKESCAKGECCKGKKEGADCCKDCKSDCCKGCSKK